MGSLVNGCLVLVVLLLHGSSARTMPDANDSPGKGTTSLVIESASGSAGYWRCPCQFMDANAWALAACCSLATACTMLKLGELLVEVSVIVAWLMGYR